MVGRPPATLQFTLQISIQNFRQLGILPLQFCVQRNNFQVCHLMLKDARTKHTHIPLYFAFYGTLENLSTTDQLKWIWSNKVTDSPKNLKCYRGAWRMYDHDYVITPTLRDLNSISLGQKSSDMLLSYKLNGKMP